MARNLASIVARWLAHNTFTKSARVKIIAAFESCQSTDTCFYIILIIRMI